MHLKRHKVPKTWPIPRKGTVYVVTPSHNSNNGLPILIALRDILKIGKTRKEAEKVLRAESVRVNGKLVKSERYSLGLLDIVDVGENSYKLVLKDKKFSLEETKDKSKISKVIGKKILSKSKVQINLSDGRNFEASEKVNVGDSILFNLESKKIEKVIPMREGSRVIVTSGSHLGEEGKLESIGNEKVEIKLEKKKVSLDKKRVMAI